MPEPAPTDGFSAPGGPVGALLIHGFTGSPASMRPWAEHLASTGLAVRLPRLPGHGTTWQEMNTTHWTDWYAEVAREFETLAGTCQHVIVCGLSMGGCLALRIAEQRPDQVAGLVLVNPSVASENKQLAAVPVLKYLVKSVAGITNDIKKPGADEIGYDRSPLSAVHSMMRMWKTTRADLPKVAAPLLLFRSADDHVVEPRSAKLILEGISSTDVTERVLYDSYHVATLDNDAPTIFAESAAFAARVAAETGTAGAH
jgi:carboxylesterase